MDLFVKVGIIVVVLIVIAGGIFVLVSHSVSSGVLTSSAAVKLVISDLKTASPNANITVINVSSSTLKAGSWNIVLAVAYNSTKPCPTLFIEAFDYPATGLVPSLDNLYTSGCVIHGVSEAPSYVISSPEIAIARSYNQSYAPIINYVSAFGYNNTFVNAKFYATLDANATNLNTQYSKFNNVWLINYTAKNAGYSQFVLMDSSGRIFANYTQRR